MNQLFWAEGLLLVVVLVLMPIYSIIVEKLRTGTSSNLKGLNLPEGSIRGMLALMSVGSFILVLVLGPGVPGIKENFDNVVTAFGTLTGAIIGFYFGNRGTGAPPAAAPPSGAPLAPGSPQATGGSGQ